MRDYLYVYNIPDKYTVVLSMSDNFFKKNKTALKSFGFNTDKNIPLMVIDGFEYEDITNIIRQTVPYFLDIHFEQLKEGIFAFWCQNNVVTSELRTKDINKVLERNS